MSKNKNYQGSKEHLENWLKAGKLGNKKIQEIKQKRIEEYNKNPKRCKNCNNTLNYNQRHNVFCSKSCANSFNNKKRILKETTKHKIGLSLHLRAHKDVEKICPICNKNFKVSWNKRNQKTCSISCGCKLKGKNPEYRKMLSDKAYERINNGTFLGWKSRKGKEPSYPEKYFISLFNNESIIGWERDYKVGMWFIDFAFIDKMIALEIDGKQHNEEERRKSDEKKDNYLIKNGWKVIRIKWYNPVNENNKGKLYKQIEELKTILKDKL